MLHLPINNAVLVLCGKLLTSLVSPFWAAATDWFVPRADPPHHSSHSNFAPCDDFSLSTKPPVTSSSHPPNEEFFIKGLLLSDFARWSGCSRCKKFSREDADAEQAIGFFRMNTTYWPVGYGGVFSLRKLFGLQRYANHYATPNTHNEREWTTLYDRHIRT